MASLGLNEVLAKQRDAQLRDGAPSAEIRIDRLDRCIGLLVDRRRDIEAALSADFGAGLAKYLSMQIRR